MNAERVSIRIQSVLYGNQKKSLLRALCGIRRAIEVDRLNGGHVGDVTVCYGDASAKPLLSAEEEADLKNRFASAFSFVYTPFGENTGTAKGHNRLGADCTADFMMIMNPDVILCPHFFAPMLEPFFDEEKNAGMTEARQTPVEHAKEYDPQTLETEWATTACAIFPTEVFRLVNGFDSQSFFMYCDDLDFSWRVRLAGKKIYYRPDAPVFHAKTLSAKGGWQPTSAEVYYSAEAALLMAHKWSNPGRCNKLRFLFSHSGDEVLCRAAAHYEEMLQNGTLPEPIDPDHKVGRFVGDDYSEKRFSY